MKIGAAMTMLARGWAWTLDYAYVAFWQLHGFLFRVDPARYRHAESQAGGHAESQAGRHAEDQAESQAGSHSAGARIPVVLIPGIYERWQFMQPIADHVHKRGHEVHVIESLGYTYRSVDALATLVEEYLSAQELDCAVVIAHSKGGLIGKQVMSGAQSGHRVLHMIAVNTPFSGSIYARYVFLPGVRALSPTNSVLRRLHENLEANSRITSIFARFDPHIPGGSELSGARNVRLDVDGHFRIMGSAALLRTIDDVLAGL